MLDADTGDLYACALGQGLLDTVMSEEKVRRELKTEEPSIGNVIINGRVKQVSVRINPQLEERGMTELEKFEFPLGPDDEDFASYVYTRNDDDRVPVPEIAAQAREVFGIN